MGIAGARVAPGPAIDGPETIECGSVTGASSAVARSGGAHDRERGLGRHERAGSLGRREDLADRIPST
jgi:hypothetical protein